MKLVALAVSLLANAGLLVALAVRPALAPPAVRNFFAEHFSLFAPASTTPAAKPVATRPVAVAARPLWSKLGSEDLATFVARLRAAGFPPSVIRALVQAEVGARYDARLRAFFEPDPTTPFWKSSAGTNFLMGNTKRMEEYSALQRERTRLLRDLLKDDFFATDDVTAQQRRQFGDLPRTKIDQLQRIEDDYAEMIAAVRSSMNGVTLPEDREKLALLNREKRADLAAVLSPEEFADYDMRSSQLTNFMRNRLGSFEPSAAEFRAIFQAHKAAGDKVPTFSNGFDADQRGILQKEIETAVRAALGDARYAEYTRETNSEFQQLSGLARRDSLPQAAVLQAFSLRDSVAQESNRIFDDPALNETQKRAALQTLAQTTRAQMLATLGTVSGPGYVKIADTWLTAIERGAAVKFSNNPQTYVMSGDGGIMSFGGSGTTYRRLPNPPEH